MLVQRSNFIQIDQDLLADNVMPGYDREDAQGFPSKGHELGKSAKVAVQKATPLSLNQVSLKYCKPEEVNIAR